MEAIVKTYEQFLEEHKEYDGNDKCFVGRCDEPAYYEGGDYRWYCGVCEKHAKMKDRYAHYLYDVIDQAHNRLLWDKGNTVAMDIQNIARQFLMKMIKEEKENERNYE